MRVSIRISFCKFILFHHEFVQSLPAFKTGLEASNSRIHETNLKLSLAQPYPEDPQRTMEFQRAREPNRLQQVSFPHKRCNVDPLRKKGTRAPAYESDLLALVDRTSFGATGSSHEPNLRLSLAQPNQNYVTIPDKLQLGLAREPNQLKQVDSPYRGSNPVASQRKRTRDSNFDLGLSPPPCGYENDFGTSGTSTTELNIKLSLLQEQQKKLPILTHFQPTHEHHPGQGSHSDYPYTLWGANMGLRNGVFSNSPFENPCARTFYHPWEGGGLNFEKTKRVWTYFDKLNYLNNPHIVPQTPWSQTEVSNFRYPTLETYRDTQANHRVGSFNSEIKEVSGEEFLRSSKRQNIKIPSQNESPHDPKTNSILAPSENTIPEFKSLIDRHYPLDAAEGGRIVDLNIEEDKSKLFLAMEELGKAEVENLKLEAEFNSFSKSLKTRILNRINLFEKNPKTDLNKRARIFSTSVTATLTHIRLVNDMTNSMFGSKSQLEAIQMDALKILIHFWNLVIPQGLEPKILEESMNFMKSRRILSQLVLMTVQLQDKYLKPRLFPTQQTVALFWFITAVWTKTLPASLYKVLEQKSYINKGLMTSGKKILINAEAMRRFDLLKTKPGSQPERFSEVN
ncbi:hypothetical protein O181_027646 [Austropuccinia psidii MF-1]|uniref:Uncharacterized protein n=1 Tax=Austropuccinia psidii MF-1 TaxID=1389203 RepID=A0A9Q3H1M6_9BASI|nr:hypothetical protein [Austropuccinia psidii MF-1]